MTHDSNSFASVEVASFWRFLGQTLDQLAGAMEGLSVEELNWRPPAPGANSIYVLANHTFGNVRWSVLELLGGQPVGRDREAEFQSMADASNVPTPGWPALRSDLKRVMAGLQPTAMDAFYAHPVFGDVNGRELLVVVIRHAAEHLGHAGVTRDLVLAARNDPSPQVCRVGHGSDATDESPTA